MVGRVVTITYKLAASRKQYIEENMPYGEPIANVPGLRWKIWIVNEEKKEAGGVYLFNDAAAAEKFLGGSIIAEMKGDPSLQIKSFEVIEPLAKITRGPIA